MQETESARASLAQDAKSLNLIQFWEQRGDIELTRPRAAVKPYRWRWSDIEPRLRLAAKTVPIEECERRALVFANPGLGGKPYITNTLFAAYSLYNPKEKAPVHRHTPSASRFVLEGDGGYTVVAGEKLTMSRGDLILTPNGTWHDHGNDGQEAVIWVDVLDVPLVESLNATVFEFDYFESDDQSNSGQPVRRQYQSVAEPKDHSRLLYGTGGVRPLFVSHKRGITAHSPMFVYRWEDTKTALEGMKDYAGSPYDGLIVEYVDPVTGSSVMPTMSFRSQLLRPGEKTLARRKTSSAIYCVLEGDGVTDVEGERLEWTRNDVFAVPSWAWHSHINLSAGDSVLYSVTDEPAVRKLELYREERRTASGAVEKIIGEAPIA